MKAPHFSARRKIEEVERTIIRMKKNKRSKADDWRMEAIDVMRDIAKDYRQQIEQEKDQPDVDHAAR